MIADPMGDMSAAPADGAEDTNNTNNSRLQFDPLAIQYNMIRIDRIRSIMGIVSGCVVGIAGITGLQGFGMLYMLWQ